MGNIINSCSDALATILRGYLTSASSRSTVTDLPPWIVGVLNITPDSFSDGGRYLELDSAAEHAHNLTADGAHIVDIGGESTRPDSLPVGAEEELKRIEPAVSVLANEYFLSIDTYRARTAARCLELGAKMINDISALRADPDMGRVVSEYRAFVALMYSKESGAHPHATTGGTTTGQPVTIKHGSTPPKLPKIVVTVADFLCRQVDYALNCGIALDRIVLDPGMGRFISNDPVDSWTLLNALDQLRQLLETRGLKLPLYVGVSRKGFLGATAEERERATPGAELTAIANGAQLIRTHSPRPIRQLLERQALPRS